MLATASVPEGSHAQNHPTRSLCSLGGVPLVKLLAVQFCKIATLPTLLNETIRGLEGVLECRETGQ